MMQNILTLILSPIACNGYPEAQIKLNNTIVYDGVVDQVNQQIAINLPDQPGHCVITVERYGKTENNATATAEQILKVNAVKIDDVAVPKYILVDNSTFSYNQTSEKGCLEFYPNGVWTFEFSIPFVTWCVKQKILNDAKFNQDYQYAWSYRLGPGQAEQLLEDIDDIIDRVKKLDE